MTDCLSRCLLPEVLTLLHYAFFVTFSCTERQASCPVRRFLFFFDTSFPIPRLFSHPLPASALFALPSALLNDSLCFLHTLPSILPLPSPQGKPFTIDPTLPYHTPTSSLTMGHALNQSSYPTLHYPTLTSSLILGHAFNHRSYPTLTSSLALEHALCHVSKPTHTFTHTFTAHHSVRKSELKEKKESFEYSKKRQKKKD